MDQDVVVVGAGPAGLATAACLARHGIRARILEREATAAASWRSHYERLHLHTVKTHSALPGLPFPERAPRYVPRQGVVDYLDAYARHHALAPELGVTVTAITRGDAGWQVETADGRCLAARAVVLATGANNQPNPAVFAEQAAFRGSVLHSGGYRNAAPFRAQRVLVVGMGNTGAEIALDLAEQGATVGIAVRSPLNIVKRDVLGRPTQLTSILLDRLPRRWGDAIALFFRDLTVGDLSRWGIRTAPISPLRQLREHGKTPVIDIGTVARIKAGAISVHPQVERFTPEGVRFVDGSSRPFDAVILATGYRAGLERLLPSVDLGLDANGLPSSAIGHGALDGLYFIGFDLRQAGGLLRTIGLQAEQVAAAIAALVGATTRPVPSVA